MTVPTTPPLTDRPILNDAVRQKLGRPDAVIAEWSNHPLAGVSQEMSVLYRYSGVAEDGPETLPWAMVVKAVERPQPDPGRSDGPWWRREAELYRSGLLNNLTGIRAPRCFAVIEQPDGRLVICLEEVGNQSPTHWSLARFALAARHLGEFNGAYPRTRPLPDHPALARPLWHCRSGAASDTVTAGPDLWRHPIIAGEVATADELRLRQLGSERERFLTLLDRLPHTFSHNDAWSANLIGHRLPDGTEETVAIDWAYAGLAPLGAEIGGLVAGELCHLTVESHEATALEESAWTGYLTGLADAGWQGDTRHVRFAYLTTVALRLATTLPVRFARVQDEGCDEAIGRQFGQSVAEAVGQWGAGLRLALAKAGEARTLANELF